MSNYILNEDEKRLLGVTNDHEWRKCKRRELDAVLEAAEVYLQGSAYTPASACDTPSHPMHLMDLLRDMRSKLTVKRWGR